MRMRQHLPRAKHISLVPSPPSLRCSDFPFLLRSADVIECGKWQFIKKWEQMGKGL